MSQQATALRKRIIAKEQQLEATTDNIQRQHIHGELSVLRTQLNRLVRSTPNQTRNYWVAPSNAMPIDVV